MGMQVVQKSFVVLESDLPPWWSHDSHPSGVLHAVRRDLTESGAIGREVHVFAWVANSLKVDSILDHFERSGFHRTRGIVFIPYSTKEDWMMRYPHAPLSVECTESGKVKTCSTRKEPAGESDGDDADDADDFQCGYSKKRKYEIRKGMAQDRSALPIPERDELHVEIYNYLTWLHRKLAEIEGGDGEALEAEGGVGGDEDKENDNEAVQRKKRVRKRINNKLGVNVAELQGVLSKLESAFYVIPNMQFDVADGWEESRQDGGPDAAQKGAPFLEEVLGEALAGLVAERRLAGKPRRRSRRKTPRPADGADQGRPRKEALRFDPMFERLEKWREQHGDCRVPTHSKEDPELGAWVKKVRYKRSQLQKRGIQHEELAPGRQLTPFALTAERIARLDAIGFVWSILPPQTPWEEHFRQLMQFREENGKWPSQYAGSLGRWIHSQRTLYSKRDENFLRTKFPKLDEVGFEWTPKGYYKISWDEGFEKLMYFGEINGHYEVPCPAYGEEDENGNLITRKSDAHKFYKWVESLHTMYRSYRLGRQSGSLTEERITLLMGHGFKFREE